ncbi:MAG: VTC domain-containing protein [Planctomycetota bacterium]
MSTLAEFATKTTDAKRDLRFERKFRVSGIERSQLEAWILGQPALFRERYRPRSVNNIYFDTLGLAHYDAHVEGNTQRVKVRVRWYGEWLGDIPRPTLELKLKDGPVGYKRSYRLEPFALARQFESSQVTRAIAACDLPATVRSLLQTVTPQLVNRYRRRYFESACGRFRMTLDDALEYYAVPQRRRKFGAPVREEGILILEVKYPDAAENDAARVISRVPFPLCRNSKYVSGIAHVYGL